MTTRKITLDISDRDLAHRVAGALQNLVDPAPQALTLFETPRGAEPPAASPAGTQPSRAPGWRVEAYFDPAPDPAALHGLLESLLDCPLPTPILSDVPDLNWVALSQSALPPVAAGRFHVHGSHDRNRIPQGPNAILIEAGEAFGTAHHATTYGCLLALDRLTRRRHFANVLDLGSGSGVLAIALARALPRARITATDLDRRSVEVLRENARANRASARIRALRAAGLDAPELRRAPPFDLVVANILAEPLKALAPAIVKKLAPDGILVLSGLLDHQADQVIATYRAHGLAVACHDRIAGWTTLALSRGGAAAARRRA